ncbi:MAG: hypothetical protein NTU53_11370 [Planctomycetota bacterium]|nr:hypothetical protein [Planctomycetota bacterium]
MSMRTTRKKPGILLSWIALLRSCGGRLWIVVLAFLFTALAGTPLAQGAAAGKPFLHPLFTDHMVLQRDVAAAIWGWTQPGKKVTVTLAGKSATGVADAQGKWLIRLGALPAGGPHTMAITGPQTAEVRDVMLGDIWICSGQSNMQMSVDASMNAKGEIAAARHPRIRFFSVPWAGLRPGGPQVMHTEPQETVADVGPSGDLLRIAQNRCFTGIGFVGDARSFAGASARGLHVLAINTATNQHRVAGLKCFRSLLNRPPWLLPGARIRVVAGRCNIEDGACSHHPGRKPSGDTDHQEDHV